MEKKKDLINRLEKECESLRITSGIFLTTTAISMFIIGLGYGVIKSEKEATINAVKAAARRAASTEYVPFPQGLGRDRDLWGHLYPTRRKMYFRMARIYDAAIGKKDPDNPYRRKLNR